MTAWLPICEAFYMIHYEKYSNQKVTFQVTVAQDNTLKKRTLILLQHPKNSNVPLLQNPNKMILGYNKGYKL